MPSATPVRPTRTAPTWSAGGEGEQLWFLGTLAIVRVPGEALGGRFSLTELVLRRHTSPALHTHPQDESYVVLEGLLTVRAGSERFQLSAGGAAAIPMGVPHTFRVDSESAHILLISTPAGIERFVLDASVPARAPTLPPANAPRPTPQEVARIYTEHACIEVGPRLEPDD
ncbi:MAG TPA: cupin domain-containing protein [Gaiellaceae bacterium]|nr:cupin domain-containing protein [Gaiellaceae bacterium]